MAVDPLFEAQLKGEFNQIKKKAIELDPFEKILNDHIENYLNSLPHEEVNPAELQFNSPRIKHLKIKQELINDSKITDIDQQIKIAIDVINSEGAALLEKEEYEQLISDLTKAEMFVQNPQLIAENTIQNLIGIDEKSMRALWKMALILFDKQSFENSTGLSTLLAVLSPVNGDYWYRTALAAQQANQMEYALQAYETAYALSPELIGAKIFTVNCLISLKRKTEAKDAFKEASELVKENELNEQWEEILTGLESLIDNRLSA